jgi:NitT/TauT family transport system substrate-binding protein
MSRRDFVIFSSAAALSLPVFGLSGCGDSSDQTPPPSASPSSDRPAVAGASPATGDYTLRVGLQQTNINPVAVIIAKEKGFFEEEGVKASFETVKTPNDGIAAITEDKLDVMNAGALGAFEGIAVGVDNIYICGGIMSEGSDYVVMADSDITLKDAESFRGRKLCGFQIDPGRMETVDYLLKAGLEQGKDYEMIVVEGTGQVIAAVESGEAEIGILNGGASYAPTMTGELKQIAKVPDFVQDYPCCRLTVNADVYNNHYSELVGYILAELRGYHYFLNNEDEVCEILSTFTGGARDPENCRATLYGIAGSYDTAMGIQMDPDTEAVLAFYELMKNISPTDVGTSLDPGTTHEVLDYIYPKAYREALELLSEREPDEKLWPEMMATFEKKNSMAKNL